MFNAVPIWLKALINVAGFLLFFIFFAGLGRILFAYLLANIYGISLNQLYELSSQPKHHDKLLLQELGGVIVEIVAVWLFPVLLGNKLTFKQLGINWKGKTKDFASGCLLGIILITAGFIIMKIMGFVQVVKLEFHPIMFMSYIIFFVCVAISEELMARGYVLSTLMKGMNKYVALSTSALIFSGLHLMNNHIALVPLFNLVLAGYLLGMYFIFQKNLMFPIGLHFTWNFFQGAVFGFEVSGHSIQGIITQNVMGNILWTGGEFGFEGSIIAVPIVIAGILFIYFCYSKKSSLEKESLSKLQED
ncbi:MULTISPECIES: CPBP family intramembrane glutamic endopeptidase [unclassified Arcicella]|uniref:CPBP family intramembrane glutamic endopeptidase n=1 Tax=unclassified Arcicella TaxID=2644986 RepID=UPI0028589E6C|nr:MULTISPECIES: CPBP family intramembrane glutamic endopeptidase [unclassified Arcicella]MDR6561848.1 membrane protease YdiL (CAAX protease family) [Arcicella sp. BE51]MDR6813994.1 membrane protease YdiL (CAAX protease family) [Arcicella sp. BE140]MDR6825299.1 membrane protease YdiL (CAAX protease family) [Arcicella sp. BE139]